MEVREARGKICRRLLLGSLNGQRLNFPTLLPEATTCKARPGTRYFGHLYVGRGRQVLAAERVEGPRTPGGLGLTARAWRFPCFAFVRAMPGWVGPLPARFLQLLLIRQDEANSP